MNWYTELVIVAAADSEFGYAVRLHSGSLVIERVSRKGQPRGWVRKASADVPGTDNEELATANDVSQAILELYDAGATTASLALVLRHAGGGTDTHIYPPGHWPTMTVTGADG